MIPRVRVVDIGRYDGQIVEIAGWLYNLRSSGKICFPQVRDGSGIIQCVAVKSALPEELFETLKHLTQESSLMVRGKVRAEARAAGGFEMDVESATIVQRVPESAPYPITPKDHGIDFLMDHRHLWLRSRRQHAALLVRHEVVKGIRDYFDSNGFVLVDAPIFTPAACEGTSTLFELDYFEDEKVFLTQSGQLYGEATAAAFGKTYCFGPVFRAEKSKTRRHLTEFWMVEPEMAYADLEDVKRVGEELIRSVIGRVLENRKEDLKVLERDTSKLEAACAPFHRMSYDDAVKKLQGKGSEIVWGTDFGNTDETLLTDDLDRPVMVDRYPAAVKAFYFAPAPERADCALGVDFIAPEGYGEIIGGGQRIHDLDLLLKRLEEHHLPREAFEWYLDLRKYGSVPHAGFGMGVERFVAWMCGLEHVRETTAVLPHVVPDETLSMPTATWPWPPELDALIAAPKHHTLILENDRVRLLDTVIPVGETVPVHTHRWPGVYHTIQFSHFIRRDGEGNLLFDSRTAAQRPGAAFLENLPPHSVENVGDCDIHLISVEIKS